MSAPMTDSERQRNYDHFIDELTTLTRKYGVAIQAVGGVTIAQQSGEFAGVSYVADSSSGDIYPTY
ncbi:MAG: hypothetical protein Q7U97_05815 [Rhodocyclaceae bacterium]|nr:hypothetical protein [Rhodocyclaceae bacterium]